ncbi:uncharacterized protein HKW66_Vig0001670 [Vigna angularis]|uniref:Uncharacterized protein n=1 Tax=Phaseolus angularis TaxID=3914 RepID=A0A8T0LD52_PHAAN|nr:uncharacterized protein HKW66_Vig0001670 [Vigna angularis]
MNQRITLTAPNDNADGDELCAPSDIMASNNPKNWDWFRKLVMQRVTSGTKLATPISQKHVTKRTTPKPQDPQPESESRPQPTIEQKKQSLQQANNNKRKTME